MDTETQRPTMGEWCTVNAKAVKTHQPLTDELTATEWIREAIHPINAMYIGSRTVFSGCEDIEYEWDEHGPNQPIGKYFLQKKQHEVWLFVSHERRNAIRVFPADVVRIEKDEQFLYERINQLNAEIVRHRASMVAPETDADDYVPCPCCDGIGVVYGTDCECCEMTGYVHKDTAEQIAREDAESEGSDDGPPEDDPRDVAERERW